MFVKLGMGDGSGEIVGIDCVWFWIVVFMWQFFFGGD